jgi:hypothetical protein
MVVVACQGQATPRASLAVQVLATVTRGVAPDPRLGLPTPAPRPGAPVANTRVQILDPTRSAAVVAEQTADGQGQLAFDLGPGTYWAIVPFAAGQARVEGLPPATFVGTNLPTGASVAAWQTVTLAPADAASVTLQVVMAGV